ncbi:hypothetical protein HDU96_008719 [Phlyctochytrium bullatum]|nr:hypothetical protein HDU96_008719 [Phlyctochytrium bullatum]
MQMVQARQQVPLQKPATASPRTRQPRSGSVAYPSPHFSRQILKEVTETLAENDLAVDDEPPTMEQVLEALATVGELLEGERPIVAIDLLSHLMDAIATQCEPLGLTPESSKPKGEEAAAEEARREFWRQINVSWLKAISLGIQVHAGNTEATKQAKSTESAAQAAVAAATAAAMACATASSQANASSSNGAGNSTDSRAEGNSGPSADQMMMEYSMEALLANALPGSSGVDGQLETARQQQQQQQQQQESFLMMMNLMLDPTGMSSFSTVPTPSPAASTAPTETSPTSSAAASAGVNNAVASIQAELDAAMGVATSSSNSLQAAATSSFPPTTVPSHIPGHPGAFGFGFPSMLPSHPGNINLAGMDAAGTKSQDKNSSTTDASSREQALDWHSLRNSVIAWADVLEWYGLVDYENGFWETVILDAIANALSSVGVTEEYLDEME